MLRPTRIDKNRRKRTRRLAELLPNSSTRESCSVVARNGDGGRCSSMFSGSTELSGLGFWGSDAMGMSSRGSPCCPALTIMGSAVPMAGQSKEKYAQQERTEDDFLEDFLGNREQWWNYAAVLGVCLYRAVWKAPSSLSLLVFYVDFYYSVYN
jgi:hypothetical protein